MPVRGQGRDTRDPDEEVVHGERGGEIAEGGIECGVECPGARVGKGGGVDRKDPALPVEEPQDGLTAAELLLGGLGCSSLGGRGGWSRLG